MLFRLLGMHVNVCMSVLPWFLLAFVSGAGYEVCDLKSFLRMVSPYPGVIYGEDNPAWSNRRTTSQEDFYFFSPRLRLTSGNGFRCVL